MKPIAVIYLLSFALSMLGNSIASIALPLLVLQITGSVLSTGILAGATAIPAFLAGILGGVVIDRINRRTSSVVSDLLSAASLAALPLIDLATGLNLGWFILLGIIGSICDVPGLTAREALLPAVIGSSGLTAEKMIGIRETIGALIIVIGPAIAGGLIVAFEGSTVLWITAATSFAAAMLTLLMPRSVGALEPVTVARGPLAQLAEGWWVLFRSNRLLLGVTLLNLVMVTVVVAFQGLILPAHFTLLGEPQLLGFVLTSIGAGTLLGGGIYAMLGARGPRRAWFVVGMLGTLIGIGLIAALPSIWVIFVGGFVLGLSLGLFGSLLGVLMLESIPDAVRGRVMGTQNSLIMLAAPLGVVGAAIVIHVSELAVAGIVMGVVWATAIAAALLSPALRNLEPNGEGVPVDAKP